MFRLQHSGVLLEAQQPKRKNLFCLDSALQPSLCNSWVFDIPASSGHEEVQGDFDPEGPEACKQAMMFISLVCHFLKGPFLPTCIIHWTNTECLKEDICELIILQM